jgi:hypothetical protein
VEYDAVTLGMVPDVLKEHGTLIFILLRLLGPVGEGNMFILNMKNYLANDSVTPQKN